MKTLKAPTGQKIKIGQHWKTYGRGKPREVIELEKDAVILGPKPKVKIPLMRFTGARNGWELCEGPGANGNGATKPESLEIVPTPQTGLAGLLERRCRYTPVGVEFPEAEQLTFPEWEEIFNFHYIQAERSHWVLGDTIIQGMRNFAEWSQVIPENRLQKKTLMNIANVAERYTQDQRKHIFDLSWSHYREVVYLEPDTREQLLDTAAKSGWTVKQLAEAKANLSEQKPARISPHVEKDAAQQTLLSGGVENRRHADPEKADPPEPIGATGRTGSDEDGRRSGNKDRSQSESSDSPAQKHSEAQSTKESPRPAGWHRCHDGLPDSDTTVLVHHPKWEEPVWIGYHDGEVWRDVSAAAFGQDGCDPAPTHWMEFPEPPEALGK